MNHQTSVVAGTLPAFEIDFLTVWRAHRRGRAPVGASLRLRRGPAGHAPVLLGRVAAAHNSLRSLALAAFKQARRICFRSALRARATRPAMLGAAEARRRAPARACAGAGGSLGRRGATRASSPRCTRTARFARAAARRLDACVLPTSPENRRCFAKPGPGGGCRASAAPSSAVARGRARSAHQKHIRRTCLNAASSSERSELCDGP